MHRSALTSSVRAARAHNQCPQNPGLTPGAIFSRASGAPFGLMTLAVIDGKHIPAKRLQVCAHGLLEDKGGQLLGRIIERRICSFESRCLVSFKRGANFAHTLLNCFPRFGAEMIAR